MILADPRTLIMEELKRRLNLAFPGVMLYEGAGSVWGEWTRALPCIHIYEQTEECKSSKIAAKNVYQNILPVQIEFVSKLQNQHLLFTEGRKKRISLRQAIELDDRFMQNKGLETEGPNLAISYLMTANEIVHVIPGVVDVAVIYDFIYIEKFFG
jgi:hypothetical protein